LEARRCPGANPRASGLPHDLGFLPLVVDVRLLTVAEHEDVGGCTTEQDADAREHEGRAGA